MKSRDDRPSIRKLAKTAIRLTVHCLTGWQAGKGEPDKGSSFADGQRNGPCPRRALQPSRWRRRG